MATTFDHDRKPARSPRRRLIRVAATLCITGLCAAYILWKINVGRTLHLVGAASPAWFAGALAIQLGSVWPMSWRWQQLLRAAGIDERLSWLTRTYFVSYTAGQVLPTSLGGDATRIYETSRRHPGKGGPVAGSVLLERALGGAATLTLAAIGFALAIGRYDIGEYLWLEGAFVVATAVGGVVLFARSLRPLLARAAPVLRFVRLERPVRAAYEGLHAYRRHVPLLVGVFALTAVVTAIRILSIWMAGKAVGVDISPRPYYVFGPLLFLVMLVPFTVNGLAVREAFFVSFLTKLGVGGSAAFATGFLFFVVTIGLSLPGLGVVLWENVRRAPASSPDAATPDLP